MTKTRISDLLTVLEASMFNKGKQGQESYKTIEALLLGWGRFFFNIFFFNRLFGNFIHLDHTHFPVLSSLLPNPCDSPKPPKKEEEEEEEETSPICVAHICTGAWPCPPAASPLKKAECSPSCSPSRKPFIVESYTWNPHHSFKVFSSWLSA